MFGHNFYHGSIRKYVIMFGNMFNDIDVVRYKKDGTAEQTIRVPIAYGPKEKFLARLRADSSLDREVAVQLPRLAFEMTNFEYAPTRSLNKLQKNSALSSDENKLLKQYTPAPYDFTFTLYGMFANNEDAVQVLEQILPFFRPEWTHSIKLIPQMGQYFDVPTVLNSVTMEDAYDADFQTRRAIIYTFTFTVKGYIFGPVSNQGVIKRTIVDLSANNIVGAPENSKVILTPGLLANGSPTTNSAASIATSQITANSDYGYAFDTENYFDGIDRHGHGS